MNSSHFFQQKKICISKFTQKLLIFYSKNEMPTLRQTRPTINQMQTEI